MVDNFTSSDFVVIRAEEPNVSIVGLTRGCETKSQHTEKLDKGEVILMQFTENVSAIKIKGKSTILTKHGSLTSGVDNK